MGRREDLLRQEEEGWAELNALIARLSPDRLEAPGYAPDGWSVKDLMWHVACWSADCVHAFEQMAAGTFTGTTIDEDTDVVNRRWFEHSRKLDLETVKAGWYSARTMMVECFAGAGELRPEADEWFDEAGPIHYRNHLDDLRGWVDRLTSTT